MSDKRHYKRFMLEGQYVLSRMNFSTEVDLIDISLGGASINTDRKLNVGESYDCRIREGEQVMSVAGTVIWQEPVKPKTEDKTEAADNYYVGLCFDKIFTSKGDNLAGLIEEWARSEHQRHRVRGVRVKLKKANAELDHVGQYRVDEISFGTMTLREENDTLNYHPPPYVSENNGNLKSRGIVHSENLWESTTYAPMPHEYYKYQLAENESSSYDWALTGSWIQMTNNSGDAQEAFYGFKWENVSDAFNLHIYIKVPGDEPPGAKYSTTYIVCEQNETY